MTSGRRRTPIKISEEKAWPKGVMGAMERLEQNVRLILLDSVESYNYLLGDCTVLTIYSY